MSCSLIYFLCCKVQCRPAVLASALAFYPPQPAGFKLFVSPEDESESQQKAWKEGRVPLHLQFVDAVFAAKEECEVLSVPSTVVLSGLIKNKSGQDVPVIKISLATPSPITLLFSHGNATDLGLMKDSLIDLALNLRVNVVSYEYSGYGPLGAGVIMPLERTCYENIDAVYSFLTETQDPRWRVDNPAANLIFYGQSVGSGPTCYIASKKPSLAVILHSPIASGLRVITENRCLAGCDIFPNVERLKEVSKRTSGVLVLHGLADDEVLPRHGQLIHSGLEKIINLNAASAAAGALNGGVASKVASCKTGICASCRNSNNDGSRSTTLADATEGYDDRELPTTRAAPAPSRAKDGSKTPSLAIGPAVGLPPLALLEADTTNCIAPAQDSLLSSQATAVLPCPSCGRVTGRSESLPVVASNGRARSVKTTRLRVLRGYWPQEAGHNDVLEKAGETSFYLTARSFIRDVIYSCSPSEVFPPSTVAANATAVPPSSSSMRPTAVSTSGAPSPAAGTTAAGTPSSRPPSGPGGVKVEGNEEGPGSPTLFSGDKAKPLLASSPSASASAGVPVAAAAAGTAVTTMTPAVASSSIAPSREGAQPPTAVATLFPPQFIALKRYCDEIMMKAPILRPSQLSAAASSPDVLLQNGGAVLDGGKILFVTTKASPYLPSSSDSGVGAGGGTSTRASSGRRITSGRSMAASPASSPRSTPGTSAANTSAVAPVTPASLAVGAGKGDEHKDHAEGADGGGARIGGSSRGNSDPAVSGARKSPQNTVVGVGALTSSAGVTPHPHHPVVSDEHL
jgi:abhydrolase domain-containing protein 17